MASPLHEVADPITEDRLKRALLAVAFIVTTHGDRYAPIFERLEREMRDFKRRRAPVDRARALLESYTVDGGLKAIR